MALYEAKRTSRNAFCWHKLQEGEGLANLEKDLQIYLNQDEMQVAYQPIYSLTNQQIVGFEALARWSHPERGEISPKIFIAIAGGDWAYSEAMLQGAGDCLQADRTLEPGTLLQFVCKRKSLSSPVL